MDQNKIENLVKQIIIEIGEDPERTGLKDTPARVAKMYCEIFKGYNKTEKPNLTIFPNNDDGVSFNGIIIDKGYFFSHCIPGGQFVNKVGGACEASKIKKGDYLWTLQKGIPTQTEVLDVSSHKAPIIVKLTLENGVSIEVTNDHPIKVEKGWAEAGTLEKGQLIEYINPKTLCKDQYQFNIGWDLGYVLGSILADGSIQEDCRICLEVNDLWFAEKVRHSFKKAFGIDKEIQPIKKPSGFLNKEIDQYRYRIVSSQIAKRLLKLSKLPTGLGSTSKTRKFHLPDIVKTDINVFKGFLKGYIDGDGTKNGNSGGFTISSSNESFINELSSLLGTTVGNNPSSPDMYHSYVSSKWFSKHGFVQNEEYSLDLGESEYVQVQNVIEAGTNTKVYSFKCSIPTFLVKGILTHNCEHHMVPFFGHYYFGYIPNQYLIGASKIGRLINYHSAKLQIAERLCREVVDDIVKAVKPHGCILIMSARHLCKEMRGVKMHDSPFEVDDARGYFLENHAGCKDEFLSRIQKH